MSWGHSLTERIRRNEPLPPLVGPVLTAATPLFRLGMWRRMRAPRVRLDATVISYGNITAGGTGKTPAVIERVQQELAAGNNVAVLTRGYGSASHTAPLVVRPNGDATGLADHIGDEPTLIAMKAPGVVIAKGSDRIVAGRKAIEKFECDTLILDDGYQYVQLERDENVLVVDATNPFGNERLLPRGILRESIQGIARATSIMLTRCDQIDDPSVLIDRLCGLNSDAPIRQTTHRPVQFRSLTTGKTLALDAFRGERVVAACAIGNPDAFAATLRSLGLAVEHVHSVRDHQTIPRQILRDARPVIVTEKDAVRIEHAPEDVFALEIALCDWPE